MTFNQTPSSERIHIGIFGKRNAGKSSLINALTNQELAIVSDYKGTTTDPVMKTMELLPLGPVVLIDTPGLDDTGSLGEMRIKKAYQMLNKTDIAILVIDSSVGMTKEDNAILKQIEKKEIPCIIAWNKFDLETVSHFTCNEEETSPKITTIKYHYEIRVSAKEHIHIHELKELLVRQLPALQNQRHIIQDLLTPGDFVVLVVPIDDSAPKGRLILPQQQTIRDILDAQATAIIVKDTDLKSTLDKLGSLVKLVVTDSQVFQCVSHLVPEQIPLTSFSILFARYKGNLETVVSGAKALDELQDNDTILISEGCTHHRQCDDIGTVKLPNLIKKYTNKKIQFEFTSGTEFPEVFHNYRMIIHCGGCMLNEREMKYRLKCAEDQHVPITNYGTAIAYMNGILDRSLTIFK